MRAATPLAILLLALAAGARADFETMFSDASKLYDEGNPKGALAKIAEIKAKYPMDYKGIRLYHVEVALAANEQQGRAFAKSLIATSFASDATLLAGLAPAVERLKKPSAATWTLALNAAKMAAKLSPKAAEPQEALAISYAGLNQKPLARKAINAAIVLAKREPKPDTVWIQWLVDRRKKLGA